MSEGCDNGVSQGCGNGISQNVVMVSVKMW